MIPAVSLQCSVKGGTGSCTCTVCKVRGKVSSLLSGETTGLWLQHFGPRQEVVIGQSQMKKSLAEVDGNDTY